MSHEDDVSNRSPSTETTSGEEARRTPTAAGEAPALEALDATIQNQAKALKAQSAQLERIMAILGTLAPNPASATTVSQGGGASTTQNLEYLPHHLILTFKLHRQRCSYPQFKGKQLKCCLLPLTSLLMISVVAALTSHCMLLLVNTRRKIESQSLAPNVPQINSFGNLGFAVCGPAGKLTVDVMILLSQAGFCIGYLIFIADTLMNLYNSDAVSDLFTIWGFGAKSVYIWACFPFQLGLNSIPSLTLLAPLSIFADVVEVGSMGVVIVKDFLTFAKHRPPVEAFGTLSSLFYGLGVAVFSFEGTGMDLHLESEMIQPEKFGKILCFTMAFTATLYGSFGVLGYLAFGKDTRDIITANMGKGLLSEIVQLGLCVNLFFTFPLMMHPVYEVVERRFSGGGYNFWMRCLLVMVVSLVAVLVPNFADILSLVGSSIFCSLAFVLPALFHYLAFKEEMRWWMGYLDLGIIGFGVVLGITGTWSSLSSILADSQRFVRLITL